MSKFTQGKWHCEYDDSKYIFGSKNEVIGELYFITPEETKANARLITVAPEMYETLHDVMNTIYNFFDDKADLYDLQAKANYINTLLFCIDKEKENTQC